MKLLLISLLLVFCMFSTSKAERRADTFEFGKNYGHIAFTKSGSIGLFEKVKRVSVVIPECSELKYVRVDINNLRGPPSVKFDWGTHTVIMEYAPLQFSVSQYTIIAKVVTWPYCKTGGRSGSPQSQVEPVDSVV